MGNAIFYSVLSLLKIKNQEIEPYIFLKIGIFSCIHRFGINVPLLLKVKNRTGGNLKNNPLLLKVKNKVCVNYKTSSLLYAEKIAGCKP